MINGVTCDGIFTIAQNNKYMFAGELSERRSKLYNNIKGLLTECFIWEFGTKSVDNSVDGHLVSTLDYATKLITGTLWFTLEQVHDFYSLFNREVLDGMHLYCMLAQKNFERMTTAIRDAFVGTESARTSGMLGIDRKAIVKVFENLTITISDYKVNIFSKRYSAGRDLLYMRLGKISDAGVVPDHPNLVGKHIGIINLV